MTIAVGSLGAAGPMIHCLSSWTLLIPAPEEVIGRLLGSVSPDAPSYENHNTTRGNLLVLKTCMKLVVYPPHFRDFDGRKLVVRTTKKDQPGTS
jgi:hypothetical protein